MQLHDCHFCPTVSSNLRDTAGNEDGDDDGVLELAPHNQYVSGLRCGMPRNPEKAGCDEHLSCSPNVSAFQMLNSLLRAACLGLQQAYHQVTLAPEDVPKTAWYGSGSMQAGQARPGKLDQQTPDSPCASP